MLARGSLPPRIASCTWLSVAIAASDAFITSALLAVQQRAARFIAQEEATPGFPPRPS